FAIKNSPILRALIDSDSAIAKLHIITNSTRFHANGDVIILLDCDITRRSYAADDTFSTLDIPVIDENASGIFLRPLLTSEYGRNSTRRERTDFGTWDNPKYFDFDSGNTLVEFSIFEKIIQMWKNGKVSKVHVLIKHS
ncbi:MAG: hypothetical protein LBT64_03730, partial [Puniceicoccales bacterium]|nr:hypothetical protein [Puniceicoccales bacterium]